MYFNVHLEAIQNVWAARHTDHTKPRWYYPQKILACLLRCWYKFAPAKWENWNTIKNTKIKTNTSMFISESKFLTFNLYNLFSLGFLIPCILFLPISAFFLASLSLPRVCFFSLCRKRFAPSLPQVSLSSPNFMVELAGKRSLRKLPFLAFLRSWRSFFACESFGDEPVIFSCLSKKRKGPG